VTLAGLELPNLSETVERCARALERSSGVPVIRLAESVEAPAERLCVVWPGRPTGLAPLGALWRARRSALPPLGTGTDENGATVPLASALGSSGRFVTGPARAGSERRDTEFVVQRSSVEDRFSGKHRSSRTTLEARRQDQTT
jgi:hypothetical protein